MKFLVTGGCGFLGTNIAETVLNTSSAELCIVDNLSRVGSEKNLAWLQEKGGFLFYKEDIRNAHAIEEIVKVFQPDVIYHLAGQVAMTTSLADPRQDFEINVLGTVNILESVRKHTPNSIVVYSSTNKVYGDLEWVNYTETETRYVAEKFEKGFSEDVQLSFHSPYGVSKGSADQYCLDYARMFNLKTVVFRHSSMFGGRQFSTADQGWIGWFCSQALLQTEDPNYKPFTISGNGKQVRDVLFASDMVKLYFSVIENIEAVRGNAFNIGGGMSNSLSLLELFAILENILDIKLNYMQLPPRISDQKIFVADLTKINAKTNWIPAISAEDGIKNMIKWLSNG